MAREAIVDKLAVFLKDREEWCEADVVYLFVQLRKLYEHSADEYRESGRFAHIKFLSDWIAHTRKDHITSEMKELLCNMQADIESMLGRPHADAKGPIDFIYMDHIRGELKLFLSEHDIDGSFVDIERVWVSLLRAVTMVLSDQPLVIRESHDLWISKLVIDASVDGSVARMQVSFCKPITGADGIGYRSFTLKNVY
ncbi:hypothetical protein I8H84_03410 [Candidatus Saccharibacteria bacterium]|nr:hypothetical protein [Candidatus Saccharibacteria bacterium]MBH1972995.1 hypothetical protein [Candidatus Saccharibacteria bacterium]MBH1991198.1 hypothetical protein [Candidatus Saccharibacteria bacterium]